MTLFDDEYVDINDDENEYIVSFYAIYVLSDILMSQNTDIAKKERNLWDKYIKDIEKNCPFGEDSDNLSDSVEHLSFRGCWIEMTEATVTSAIQGIFIAMPLAFVVLLLSTKNRIVSLFAVINII